MIAEAINDYLIKLMEGFLQAAWKWLGIFMLQPTDFKLEGNISDIQTFILGASIGITTLFTIFALMKELTKGMGGYANRSNSEIISKSILGICFAYTSPWIVLGLVLTVSNALSSVFLERKLNIDTLKTIMDVTNTADAATVVMAFFLTIIILWMTFQYIVRYGNMMILLVLGPFAASTIVNEEMNIFPAWWRELCAVIFTQPLQLMILYFIIELFGSGHTVENYFMAIGLMVVLISSPGWLRKMLFSTGSGKSMINAAGGMGRMAMYRLMMRK